MDYTAILLNKVCISCERLLPVVISAKESVQDTTIMDENDIV